MERDINLDEISDGKLYEAGDLVKVGCNDCEGCSACCHGMGSSIILDPYDMWQLARGLGKGFEALFAEGRMELNMADGVILPNLRLAGGEEGCTFLNGEGRCTIHDFRPGLCRLFPLGRIYEGNSFRYFLQVHECHKDNRTKLKVKKWLGIPELKAYERFVADWHFYLKEIQERVKGAEEEEEQKRWNLLVLRSFYLAPWDGEEDFYPQFYDRLRNVQSA